jgi:hypothetical protein
MPIEGNAAAVIGQHKEECELEERMETENKTRTSTMLLSICRAFNEK